MSRHAARRCDGSLSGVGGLRLAYRTWETAAPRAAILLIHGLSDHSGRYEAFGRASAAAGFSTFAFDQRGHGESEGRRGHAASFELLLQDLDRFRREVQGLVDVRLPLFLLGHSMGGLVALRYLEEYEAPIRGGLLLSPWLGTALETPDWKLALARTMSRIAPALPFRARIPAALLSHDEEAVRSYRDDPFVHDRITPRLFIEASRAMSLARERADRLRVPLLFMLAGEDRIADTARAEAFVRSIDRSDVTVRVVPGAYHELLHETRRDAVRRELHAWIRDRLEARPVRQPAGG